MPTAGGGRAERGAGMQMIGASVFGRGWGGSVGGGAAERPQESSEKGSLRPGGFCIGPQSGRKGNALNECAQGHVPQNDQRVVGIILRVYVEVSGTPFTRPPLGPVVGALNLETRNRRGRGAGEGGGYPSLEGRGGGGNANSRRDEGREGGAVLRKTVGFAQSPAGHSPSHVVLFVHGLQWVHWGATPPTPPPDDPGPCDAHRGRTA